MFDVKANANKITFSLSFELPCKACSRIDDRSKLVIYLGRKPRAKACRLYDPEKGKISVSGDVIFEEIRVGTGKNTNKRVRGLLPRDHSLYLIYDRMKKRRLKNTLLQVVANQKVI